MLDYQVNLTKFQLAKLISKHIKGTKVKILKNKKDPDKKNYFVSNKKIEKLGLFHTKCLKRRWNKGT